MDDQTKILTAAMDNVDAHRLGQLAIQAGKPDRSMSVGDMIDRGLILRRLLEEAGYGIVKLPKK